MDDAPARPPAANPIVPRPAPPKEQALDDPLSNEQLDSTDEEVDVWWGAYAGRTMWPSFVVCVLLTAAIAALAWHFYDAYQAHPRLMRYLAYGLTGVVWVSQLGRWLYRTVSVTYRLTTRRLFRDHGFHHPDAGWVELPRLRRVEVVYGSLERKLGIGRLYVYSEDRPRPLVLEGVRDPERVATRIMRGAEQARLLAQAASRT